VGLIQRAIETAGISTISISLSKDITRKLRPPRALFTGFPLGHPIGFPGQPIHQLRVLRLLLKYLREIGAPGTLIELDSTDLDKIAASPQACDLKGG